MPAEKVRDESGNGHVRVAWAGQGSGMVQVAALMDDGAEGADRVLAMVNEWLAAAKMDPIDVEKLKRDIQIPPPLVGTIPSYAPWFEGWHLDFDRFRINQLIRNLRHARDSAFGKDE